MNRHAFVWQDIKGGMGAGQSEKVEMRKAIQGATVVVVFFSFKYLRSDNCIREISHALRARRCFTTSSSN